MVFEMGEFTSQNYMYIFIVCVCLFVLFLSSFQKKRRLVLGLVERGILGFVTIIGLDQLFSYLALDLFVGVNLCKCNQPFDKRNPRNSGGLHAVLHAAFLKIRQFSQK